MSPTSTQNTRLQSALHEARTQFPKFHRNYLEAKRWTQADNSLCWALTIYADQMWHHAAFFYARYYPSISLLLLDLAYSAWRQALSRQITFDGGVA
ncbi:MAG: hypothetical protein ABF459_08545 [Gluconobacter cerinus]|uniref:hypothetical protein n=1 Tax=Gluconobacter cerinus TaxID=38307 RepID=UPI0039E736B6